MEEDQPRGDPGYSDAWRKKLAGQYIQLIPDGFIAWKNQRLFIQKFGKYGNHSEIWKIWKPRVIGSCGVAVPLGHTEVL